MKETTSFEHPNMRALLPVQGEVQSLTGMLLLDVGEKQQGAYRSGANAPSSRLVMSIAYLPQYLWEDRRRRLRDGNRMLSICEVTTKN